VGSELCEEGKLVEGKIVSVLCVREPGENVSARAAKGHCRQQLAGVCIFIGVSGYEYIFSNLNFFQILYFLCCP
jgi:hypothetical protein